MVMLDRLAETLKAAEGYRRHPYRCPAGKWTVGYGRNLEDNGISQEEAEYLLRNDIASAIGELSLRVPGLLETLSDVRVRVLLEMAVNMGVPRLMRFRRMLEALKVADYQKAAEEILDSDAARRLPGRYARLAEMMRKDEDEE